MASNRPEFVAALHAIWRLAAAVVLISPAWKRHEVEHALALTNPSYAVGDHQVLPASCRCCTSTNRSRRANRRSACGPPPEADAVLAFSSGTTGLPKAVRHTHRSLQAAVGHWREALGLTARDRIQVATPPSHILGLLNIITALRTGVWMRLHRRFDIDRMLRHIESDRITVEMAVAPIALAIASHPHLESYDLSSLRFIMWGATPVSATSPRPLPVGPASGGFPRTGPPNCRSSPVIRSTAPRLDSVGRPVPGVQVRVVSLQTGEPVGPGEVGEIQARAESLMAGYLPSEATRDALCDGWYRTGDVGYLDAGGWLRITDRSKEMIKVRGFQVAPAEIEAVLHGHPAVEDCAVFGVPDGVDGESVVAAVATRATRSTPPNSPRGSSERLASYKRLSRVVFVPEIPRAAVRQGAAPRSEGALWMYV